MRLSLSLALTLTACSTLLFACSSDNGDGFACTNGQCPSGYTCVDENGNKVCRQGVNPGKDASVDKPGTTGDAKTDTPPNPCLKQPDGTDCSTIDGKGWICRSEVCTASTCGDDFVDPKNGEDCDDGNNVPDDGCDQCRFNCKDNTGCDDLNPCNGVETCDTTAHKCKPGTPADNAACTLEGGAAGICNAGTCAPAGCGNKIKEGTEECDDGNKVDGDGCNNDCTYSCHADTDCDDNDKCTGTETCDLTTHACKLGTPVDCDDKLSCNTDSCDPATGTCTHVAIDADKDGHGLAPCGDDCNDNDPTIFPGAIDCPDGKDNDCNGKIDDNPTATGKCWADPDGDGYAATNAAMISSCNCPTGYTNRDPSQAGQADCMPTNKYVHPGQTDWYTAQYCTSLYFCLPGQPCSCPSPSWDYNCNGKTDLEYPNLNAACTLCKSLGCILAGTKCSGEGWTGTTVPDCNVTAGWKSCTYIAATNTCITSLILNNKRTQGCH